MRAVHPPVHFSPNNPSASDRLLILCDGGSLGGVTFSNGLTMPFGHFIGAGLVSALIGYAVNVETIDLFGISLISFSCGEENSTVDRGS